MLIALLAGAARPVSRLGAAVDTNELTGAIEQLAVALRHHPTAKTERQASYDHLRHRWQTVAWLHPLAVTEADMERVDANRHYLSYTDSTGTFHPASGAWQQLEYLAVKGEATEKSVSAATLPISEALQRIAGALKGSPPTSATLRFLMAVEVYRQYTLTLSGHHRLQPAKATEDFSAFLQGLHRWAKAFGWLTDQELTGVNQLADSISGLDFDALQRFQLYRQRLAPMYHRLMTGVDRQQLTQRYQLPSGNDLYGADYLTDLLPAHTASRTRLGQLLFFDPALSGNGKRTCASCHQPSKAFTDGRSTSMAYKFPRRISRNAPSLIGLSTGRARTGVDLGKTSLGHFIQSVFDHPQELRVSMDTIVSRLSSSAGYRTAFRSAFGTPVVDSARVVTALEAYVLSLRASATDFDRLRSGVISQDSVRRAIVAGHDTFLGSAGCGSCHFAPHFNGLKPPFFFEPEVHPIQYVPASADEGLGATLANDAYRFFFRTAGLRNLKYSAPYGFDGHYIKLSDFLANHYSIGLSEKQEADIQVFLSALTGISATDTEAALDLPDLSGPHQNISRRPAGVY